MTHKRTVSHLANAKPPLPKTGNGARARSRLGNRPLLAQVIDPLDDHFVDLVVVDEEHINRQLLEWGVKSRADRTRLLNSIRAAAQKACNRPRLPRPGRVMLYADRKSDPKLEYANVIEFLRSVWGKWIEARVLT